MNRFNYVLKATIFVLFIPVACAQTSEHETHMSGMNSMDHSLAKIQQSDDTDKRKAMMREHMKMMQSKMQDMQSHEMGGGMGKMDHGGGGMGSGCAMCGGEEKMSNMDMSDNDMAGMDHGAGSMSRGEGGMGGMDHGDGGMMGGMMQHHNDVLGMMQQIISMQQVMLDMLEDEEE